MNDDQGSKCHREKQISDISVACGDILAGHLLFNTLGVAEIQLARSEDISVKMKVRVGVHGTDARLQNVCCSCLAFNIVCKYYKLVFLASVYLYTQMYAILIRSDTPVLYPLSYV